MKIQQVFRLATITAVLPAVAAVCYGQPTCPEDSILTASDPAPGAVFGQSIAESDGTMVVGARGAGKAYIFERSNGAWVQTGILPPDGQPALGEFGHQVAICGDIVLVGALLDGTNGDQAGMVYAYERDSDSTWVLRDQIVPNDSTALQRFGSAVALEAGVAAIGAYYDNEGAGQAGAVYIFARQTDGTWLQDAKIVAPDAETGARLGGSKIVINRGTVFACASWDDTTSGSVYAFEREAEGWTVHQKLLASDGAPGSYFGSWLGSSGNRLAIGANSTGGGGTVYMFDFSPCTGGWIETAQIRNPSGRQFGDNLALSGDVLVVGDTMAFDTGAVFQYNHDSISGSWEFMNTRLGSDAHPGDQFGYEVIIAAGEVVAGGLRDTDGQSNAGAAYVFGLNSCECKADINGDHIVDTRDVLAYLNLWTAGCP